MVAVRSPAEQRVVLRHVSWETYERLLADNAGASTPRVTYDRGTLELMSPLPEHERLNRAVQLLVPLVGRRLGVPVYSLGSTTFRREDMQRGFEPDSCFYIQHASKAQGKQSLDLTIDPPPDLVVEIDISHPSLPRLPIYAAFGVPEVWRHDGERCAILRLGGGDYGEHEQSGVLPGVTAAALSDLLGQGRWLDDAAFMGAVQEWARQLPDAETRGPS